MQKKDGVFVNKDKYKKEGQVVEIRSYKSTKKDFDFRGNLDTLYQTKFDELFINSKEIGLVKESNLY